VQTNGIDALVVSTIAAMCRREPSSIGLDTTVQELGLDSLGLSLVAAEIESALSRNLSEQHLAQLLVASSLRDIVTIASEAR
jgi:acyl carrier protein